MYRKLLLLTLIAQGGALMAAAQKPASDTNEQAQLRARVARLILARGTSYHIATYNGSKFAAVVRNCCCAPDPVQYLSNKYTTDSDNLTDYDRELAKQLAEAILDTKVQKNLTLISNHKPTTAGMLTRSALRFATNAIDFVGNNVRVEDAAAIIAATDARGNVVDASKITRHVAQRASGSQTAGDIAEMLTRRFVPVRPASN